MRNHYLKNALVLGMAAILFTLSIPGCRKTVTETEPETAEQTDSAQYLTNIYRATEIQTDADTTLVDLIQVTEDTLVFHATKRITEAQGVAYVPYLCTVPVTGGQGTMEDVSYLTAADKQTDAQSEITGVERLALLPDGGIAALVHEYDKEKDAHRYYVRLFRDGAMTAESEELSTLFPTRTNSYFSVDGCWADKDGYLYLTFETNLLLLAPDLSESDVIRAGDYLMNAVTDSAGTVYFPVWRDALTLVPVERERGKLGTPLAMPEGIAEMDGLFFGADDTLCGYNASGIYTINTDASDGAAETLVMDFSNSNVAGYVNYVRALPDGGFLIDESDAAVAVYEKAPDLDLSTITTLQVCYINPDSSALLSRLTVRYNKAHPDKRVVLKEFNAYEDDERLGRELRTGTYRPDVLVGSLAQDAYRTLIEDDWFLDLMPYVDKDATFNRENIFGYVFHSYTKDDKLYGIPARIDLRTVIANKSVVGERSGWTTHEFVTFLNALPEGTVYDATIDKMTYYELFGGQSEMLSAFIDWDAKTCSFDSEDFLALLSYIDTLPETGDFAYDVTVSAERPYGIFTNCRTGKALATKDRVRGSVSSFLYNDMYFGKDNIAYCGFPTADGKNGTLVNREAELFTILSSSAEPELAWDYLKTCASYVDPAVGSEGTIPVLRDRYRALYAGRQLYYFMHYSGVISGSDKPLELDENGMYGGSPGEACSKEDVDFDAVERWLDASGAPALQFAYPEELSNIISEEIGTYLGGARSAEETAKMLQSRVSVYLAEQN